MSNADLIARLLEAAPVENGQIVLSYDSLGEHIVLDALLREAAAALAAQEEEIGRLLGAEGTPAENAGPGSSPGTGPTAAISPQPQTGGADMRGLLTEADVRDIVRDVRDSVRDVLSAFVQGEKKR